MPAQQHDHIIHAMTVSLCAHCMESVPAKIILRQGSVFLRKWCNAHGEQEALLEEDAAFYLARTAYDKPGTVSLTQTKMKRGCPHDCGLCPDHEQHTCIGLIEVTNQCDLGCPVCFASADAGDPLPLHVIDSMMNNYIDSEFGRAEILQISGGEPTTHPQILDILRMAREKQIGFVMLNTNGLRIAEDEEFVRALGEFQGRFEIYLQFDGVSDGPYQTLRGRSLFEVKQRAIDRLARHNVPVTLVSTIARGVNEDEVGAIVNFGLQAENVRGVNFQPLAYFGRCPSADPLDRATLTGILHRIERQTSGMIRVSDFLPLPCDTDRVAVTYLYRQGDTFIPITRNAKVKDYLPLIKNTLYFDARDIFSQTAQGLLSGNFCQCLSFLKDFLPLAPVGKNLQLRDGKLRYPLENTFRITVTSFLDAHNFEMRAMKKECVHILTPDGRKMPFSAYNILHRAKELAHV